MSPDVYLLVFALAFLGCVLAIPVVTRVAHWAGAIDRPDQFRRIHIDATPRLGGLGLAFGVMLGLIPTAVPGLMPGWLGYDAWVGHCLALGGAAALTLMIGFLDDTRGVSPRVKLIGQALAVVALYAGGIRIEQIDLFGVQLHSSFPVSMQVGGREFGFDPPSFVLTLVWFLGCMNVWNLIDGMDGLASGVGLLVTVCLMLVAFSMGNYGAALLAASLAGGLAGFLLYNWHPACIFLGDSGSLLIGLLLGVIGIQGSTRGGSSVWILLPVLAMGLPISDTMLAIFRRWARNLPLTAADRRHVHHLLIGLGLNPRQAAAFLYIFTAFLCGVVLMGVAARSQGLALALAVGGCAAFMIVLYSRRDELTNLRSDLNSRLLRGRQERAAAKVTWEAIQRIELAREPGAVLEIVGDTGRLLGCEALSLRCAMPDGTVHQVDDERELAAADALVSRATADFRLVSSEGAKVELKVSRVCGSEPETDITFRFIQRLGSAAAERFARIAASSERVDAPSPVESSGPATSRIWTAMAFWAISEHGRGRGGQAVSLAARHAGPGRD